MIIKQGNYIKLKVGPIRKKDKSILTNLPTATAVRYLVKEDPDDTDATAIISKSLSSGITVDDPSTGYISVEVLSTESMLLTEDLYYHGLQVKYSSTNWQNIIIRENGQEIKTFDVDHSVVKAPS